MLAGDGNLGLKLMVVQSSLAGENWAGPAKFDVGQVKLY